MAWVKAAVVFIASIWGYVKVVAAVAYVIYLWNQKKKANQSPTYGFDIQTQCSNELPVPIVYGKVKAGGNIVWQRMSYDKSTIYALVAFSEGPIKGFEDVRANDIPIKQLPGCYYTPYLGTDDQLIDSRCPGGVGFFKDSNYGGKAVTLSAGNYTAADLAAAGIVEVGERNDHGYTTIYYYGSWTSSIKVNHHKVTLYSGENFDGDSLVLTEDVTNLKHLSPNLNDRVYSLKIEPLTNADRVKVVGGLRNVAYIAFTIKASDKLSGGMPNFTAIVKGRKVRTWENESWITKFSENPAWHLYDLLTHSRYGGGYTDDQINIESFKTAAAFCDELLDDGQPRFTEGIIIDWVESLPDIVDQIRLTCRGYVVSYNGKLTFKIEQPEEPCQHFGMEHIVEDSLEIYMPGKDEEWQKVTVTYCEPNQNWAKIPAQSVDESNPIYPTQKDFTIVGINRFSQGSRQAYFYRVYSKFCRFSGKFKTTIRALNRIPGDVITITDDIMGWVKKPVRILEIRHAGDHGHEIYFREYNETIYTDSLGSVEPTANYSEMPNPFAIPPDPTNLVVAESSFVQKSGEVVPEIRITFTPGHCMNYSYSLIQLSEDGGETWLDKGQTIEGKTFISGIRTNYNYLVKVITITAQGVASEGVVSPIIIEGKNQLPSDVPKLTISQNNGRLKATVTLVDDPDVEEYELRYGPSWENSTKAINNFPGPTSEEFDAPQAGTITFWAKAVDRSRLKSKTAAKYIIEVIQVAPKNAIYERDEDLSAWTGKDMFLDPWGRWHIQAKERIGSFANFFDMFNGPTLTLEESPQLILPVADLGHRVLQADCYYIDPWGYLHLKTEEELGDFERFFDMFNNLTIHKVAAQPSIKTFLGIKVDFNQNVNNRIDVQYRTRTDGDDWSAWATSNVKEFTGRRVETMIKPVSLDGKTNVIITGAKIEVDVPDVTEELKNISVPETGLDYVYKQRFYIAPFLGLYTYDSTGMSVTHRKTNETNEGFHLELLDSSGLPVTGKIAYGTAIGY